MIEIPKQLQKNEFRFVLLQSKEKKPIEEAWTLDENLYERCEDKSWIHKITKKKYFVKEKIYEGELHNYKYNDKKLLEHLKKDGNYGVLCGIGNLIILDIDNLDITEELEKILPETFTIETGSGKRHYYYIVNENDNEKIILDKNGEHFGELQGIGTQCVGPNSIHPKTLNKYKVLKDIEINNLTHIKIEALKQTYKDNKIIQTPNWNFEKNKDTINISSYISLNNLLNLNDFRKNGDEYYGIHPIHGSTTGMNFWINLNKNLVHCFRHNCGYDSLGYLAIKEGIIQCGEKLNGKNFIKTLQIAREKYNYDIPEENINQTINENIKYIDDKIKKWENIKEEIKNKFYKENILQMICNSSFVKEGKILTKLYDDTKGINLVTIVEENYKNEDNKKEKYEALLFIDDQIHLKRKKIINSLKNNFYIYLFYSENKKYLILSENEIKDDMCKVVGMEIEIKDTMSVGESSFIPIDTTIIMCKEIIPLISKYNKIDELLDDVKELHLTHDKIFNYLLSRKNGKSYRHPKLFEELMMIFLLSSTKEYDEYPLHLLIMGKQGTGKTWFIDSLHNKLGEDGEIIEGSGSTIKTLIPSFKSQVPEPGAMLKAKRLCVTDEFFRLLLRTRQDERNNILTTLNPLLEHKERLFGTGSGSIRGKASAKFLAVTNPVYGHNSIVDLVENIDNSFLARLLIWNQSDKHVDFVRENSGNGEENYFEIKKETLLSIIDFFIKNTTTFDINKVIEIYKKYKTQLPNQLEDLYSNRYKHHIKCIMDGIIKYRCLLENDNSLQAKENDYEKLNEIWREMIFGWTSINLTRLEKEEKIKYLTSFEKFIYEEIVKYNGIWDYQIEEIFNNKAPQWMVNSAIETLIKFNLILKNNHKYELFNKNV